MPGGPNLFVPVALALFIPVVFGLFAGRDPRRAVLLSLLGGWLLLPVFDRAYDVPLLHSKAMFVPAVVLAAALLFDTQSWRRLRLRRQDLPVAVFCLASLGASVTNELGVYDGLQSAFETAMVWGVPYFLGRVYFGTTTSLQRFTSALVTSALAYVPLSLWEVRMSPQLHRLAYGYSTFGFFGQSIRFGGYRPSVFLSNGLMLAMFMTSATLAVYWMWRARVPGWRALGWRCAALAGMTLLTKSLGAIVLLGVGLAVLEGTRGFRTPALIIVLLLIPPAYCTARLSGWSGEALVEVAGEKIDPDRAQSLDFRIKNENMLMQKAVKRPWFGWGRWGRSRVFDEEGRDVSITDGMWILTLGVAGLVGLVAQGLILLSPAAALLRRFPPRYWADRRLAPAAALAVTCLLWSIDNLFNAMMTPFFPAMAGSLVSFLALRPVPRSRPASGAPPPASEPGLGVWARDHAR